MINKRILQEFKTIPTQMTEEQYNDAEITFKDITIIRELFKKRLQNIYHVRISYPT